QGHHLASHSNKSVVQLQIAELDGITVESATKSLYKLLEEAKLENNQLKEAVHAAEKQIQDVKVSIFSPTVKSSLVDTDPNLEMDNNGRWIKKVYIMDDTKWVQKYSFLDPKTGERTWPQIMLPEEGTPPPPPTDKSTLPNQEWVDYMDMLVDWNQFVFDLYISSRIYVYMYINNFFFFFLRKTNNNRNLRLLVDKKSWMLERVMRDLANMTITNGELEEKVKDLVDTLKTQDRKQRRLKKKYTHLAQVASSYGISLSSTTVWGQDDMSDDSNNRTSVSSNTPNHWSGQYSHFGNERERERRKEKRKDTVVSLHDRNFSGLSMGSQTSVQSGQSLQSLNHDTPVLLANIILYTYMHMYVYTINNKIAKQNKINRIVA
ncbi:hypothetical protein RFI_13095, partial [Reticulomyxa filosa]